MDVDLNNLPDGTTITETHGARIIKGPDGRFLPGTRPPHPITAESSLALHARRRELKREVIVQAANDSVNAADFNHFNPLHGELTFVAAITKALMAKATDHKDPKAVDAARLILSETGLSEREDGSIDQVQPANALAALVMRWLDRT